MPPGSITDQDLFAEDGPDQDSPEVSGYLSYTIHPDQPLRGQPIRHGRAIFLSAEEKAYDINLALHINGISFSLGLGEDVTISWSPFTLVRNCKFQSTTGSNEGLVDYKIFKVSLFSQGLCYYFGVRSDTEQKSDELRSGWVVDISRTIRLVTQSLFPVFRLTCKPLTSVPSTANRLLAGYLVHLDHDDSVTASVLFAELHPHNVEQAKLLLYENHRCLQVQWEILLTQHTAIGEKVGINCNCLCVAGHDFATRTLAERKLWLRALSNVRVKLLNLAPPPDKEEIDQYRQAIQEHLQTIQPALQSLTVSDPLLPLTSFSSFKVSPKAELDDGICPLDTVAAAKGQTKSAPCVSSPGSWPTEVSGLEALRPPNPEGKGNQQL